MDGWTVEKMAISQVICSLPSICTDDAKNAFLRRYKELLAPGVTRASAPNAVKDKTLPQGMADAYHPFAMIGQPPKDLHIAYGYAGGFHALPDGSWYFDYKARSAIDGQWNRMPVSISDALNYRTAPFKLKMETVQSKTASGFFCPWCKCDSTAEHTSCHRTKLFSPVPESEQLGDVGSVVNRIIAEKVTASLFDSHVERDAERDDREMAIEINLKEACAKIDRL